MTAVIVIAVAAVLLAAASVYFVAASRRRSGPELEPPLQPIPPSPKPPSAPVITPPKDVAAVQGRLVVLSTKLVKDARTRLDVPAPAAPRAFPGPDGELLRLQDEAMRLAIEVLRTETP